MRCPICAFDDEMPIGEALGGAIKIWPRELGEVLVDPEKRKNPIIKRYFDGISHRSYGRRY